MSKDNRLFVSGLLPTEELVRLPPKTEMLQGRSNRLAQLAGGRAVSRMHELVDPGRCRMWEGHNRDYQALDEKACADLIESFLAQGQQEVPAIVRRVRGDKTFDFDVVCGARRHWTATWLRQNGNPNFLFLVEPRELSDEEAFRIGDLENRSRRDLTDIERARDYVRAVDRYYDGDQRKMAQRLKVTDTWLSRFLDLARMPEVVIGAFGTPQVIGISHSAQISPLLRAPLSRERVLAIAQELEAMQVARRESGDPYLQPAEVVKRLRDVQSVVKTRSSSQSSHVVHAPDGKVLMSARRTSRGGSITINIPSSGSRSSEELMRACADVFRNLLD